MRTQTKLLYLGLLTLYALLGSVPASAQCIAWVIGLDFLEQPVGSTSTTQNISWTNYTNLPNQGPPTPMTIASISVYSISRITVGCGPPTSDFTFGGTCLVGLVLMPGDSCNVTANFSPQSLGPLAAEMAVFFTNGSSNVTYAQGSGVATNFTRPTVPVVEYYDAALDKYLITSATGEIAALDAGKQPGWTRTGATFNGLVYDGFLESVCRYYVITSTLDFSHWYFYPGYRCGWLEAAQYGNDVQFFEEDQDVFALIYPSVEEGWCPYATIPLYGFWDGKIGHRYTTSPAIRAEMIAQGWVPEGYGPDPVWGCVSR